jgi:hypothetical protein
MIMYRKSRSSGCLVISSLMVLSILIAYGSFERVMGQILNPPMVGQGAATDGSAGAVPLNFNRSNLNDANKMSSAGIGTPLNGVSANIERYVDQLSKSNATEIASFPINDLPSEIAVIVLKGLSVQNLYKVLKNISIDDLSTLLQRLPQDQVNKILAKLSVNQKSDIQTRITS